MAGVESLTWTPCVVRLGDLRPWEHNPRRMGRRQAERLLRSWRELGQFQTIAIGPNGEVYDGHQRLSVLLATYGPDYEVLALRASRSLTDDERRILVLQANNPVGAWNWEILRNWDQAILTAGGFDNAWLQQMREDIRGFLSTQVSHDFPMPLDDAEALQARWGTKTGQVWRLGPHRVACGDCTDAAVVKRLLAGACPLLMVTDPPYGVCYDAVWREKAAREGKLERRSKKVGGFDDTNADWTAAWRLFPGDVAYVFSAAQNLAVVSSLQAAGFEIHAGLVWVKPQPVPSRGNYAYQHETIWYAVRQGRPSHWIGQHRPSTVWEIGWDTVATGGHGAQKPVECMERPIRYHAGDVYDPFLGSGTTIIACEHQKRTCYGVEIEPRYVAVTLQRWVDLTGEIPQVIDE